MLLTLGSCSHRSLASEEKQQGLKTCYYKISMKILLNLTACKDYMKVTKVHIIIFYKHTEAVIYVCYERFFFYTRGKGEEGKIKKKEKRGKENPTSQTVIFCITWHHKIATGLHIKCCYLTLLYFLRQLIKPKVFNSKRQVTQILCYHGAETLHSC